MADLTNVQRELADRIAGAQLELAQRGIVTVVTTGQRSIAEAQSLWDRMIEAKKRWGNKWQQHAALAAVPGTSKHCRIPSEAVDLALANPTKANLKAYNEVCKKWGPAATVASEYWHQELAPNRGPMPGLPTKEQIMTLVIEPVGETGRSERAATFRVGATSQ